MSERKIIFPTPIDQLQSIYPDLFGIEGLHRQPTTVNELLAAHQFLRGMSGAKIVLEENQLIVEREGDSFSVGCELYGQADGYVMGWGATVEGSSPQEDIIEPHLIVPPQTDGVILTLNASYDPQRPDVAIFGIIDGKNGKKTPMAGTAEELGAQVIPGGKGKIYLWKGYQTYAISVSHQIVIGEDGQPTYLSPDNLLNLSQGGIYLVLVRGINRPKQSYVSPTTFLDDLLRGTTRGGRETRGGLFGLGDQEELVMKGLETTRSAELPPSVAAKIGYGRHIGQGVSTEFDFDWSTATPIFLRVRVNIEMPPLQGTPEWVAWLNSQRELGTKYSVVACNYCGGQVGENVALIQNGRLNVICSCPSCGSRSFSVAEYRRTKRE